MSRATGVKLHCMRANEFEGLKTKSKDAKTKSANRVEVVTIQGPTPWQGTFYQKFYENPRLAKLEATLLVLQGTPIEDIAICVIDGKDTLLTRDNQMISIDEAFTNPDFSLQLSRLKSQPSLKLIQSLLHLLIFDLFWKNYDRHIHNLAFSPYLQFGMKELDSVDFIGIDLDDIDEFIRHNLKEPRSEWVNTSSAGCFDITPNHFDMLYTDEDHTFPSFHPFQPNTIQLGNHNAYTPTMCEFFNALRSHENFETLLLEEIIVTACDDDTSLLDAFALFELPHEDQRLLHDYFRERLRNWHTAVTQSQRTRDFLLQPGNLEHIKRLIGNNPIKILQLNHLIELTIIPTLVSKYFKEIIDIISKYKDENKRQSSEIDLPIIKKIITILHNCIQHKWTLEEALQKIAHIQTLLTPKIPHETQEIRKNPTLLSLIQIEQQLCTLTSSLTKLSDEYALEDTPKPIDLDYYSDWADRYTDSYPDTVWIAGKDTDTPETDLGMSIVFDISKPKGTRRLAALAERDEGMGDSLKSLTRDSMTTEHVESSTTQNPAHHIEELAQQGTLENDDSDYVVIQSEDLEPGTQENAKPENTQISIASNPSTLWQTGANAVASLTTTLYNFLPEF